MPAWATIVLTLGSTAIGAAAAVSASWMQLRSARREREAAEAASWRARGAAVLGPLMGVLDDLEPGSIAASGGRSEQTMANIGRRWWRARDDLLVYGTANPAADVAHAASELADAVAATWTSVTRLNVDPGSNELLRTAARDHESARKLALVLVDVLRKPR